MRGRHAAGYQKGDQAEADVFYLLICGRPGGSEQAGGGQNTKMQTVTRKCANSKILISMLRGLRGLGRLKWLRRALRETRPEWPANLPPTARLAAIGGTSPRLGWPWRKPLPPLRRG